jgi:predicted RNA binding protein YcfA (HicA-like mRNA interferase family)
MLTAEQLQASVPAIYAESPSPKVSENYRFVKTTDYIDALQAQGWYVHDARGTQSRKKDPQFGRHMVVLKNTAIERTREDLGGLTPSIYLINSHDHTSLVRGFMGLIRSVCENGLMAGSVFSSFAFKHTQSAKEVADVITAGFLGEAQKLVDTADRWSAIELTPEERVQLATDARLLRFGEESTIEPVALLTPRRPQDAGTDLWRTMNVIQENCMVGGIRYQGMKRRSRELTNIGKSVEFNTELWNRANKLSIEVGEAR